MANRQTLIVGTPDTSEGVTCEAPAGYGIFCVIFLGIYAINPNALVPALIVYTVGISLLHVVIWTNVRRATQHRPVPVINPYIRER